MRTTGPRAETGGGASREGVRLCLRVPAELDSLHEVRDAVSTALERTRWRDDRPGDVLLAVSEAVENAIEHGSEPGQPVEVDIAVTPADARVRVADRGRPGARWPEREPVAPPPGSVRGRGRIIMRSLADRCVTSRAGGGTEVVLHFSRSSH